jgi:hypothetical protein
VDFFLPTGHDQTRLDVHTSAVRHRLAGLSMATLLEMMIGAISGGATLSTAKTCKPMPLGHNYDPACPHIFLA